MKKLLMISLVPLMLSGCMYQTVNSYDIMRASAVCKGVEDIHEITSNFLGVEYVTCKSKGFEEELGGTYKNLKGQQ